MPIKGFVLIPVCDGSLGVFVRFFSCHKSARRLRLRRLTRSYVNLRGGSERLSSASSRPSIRATRTSETAEPSPPRGSLTCFHQRSSHSSSATSSSLHKSSSVPYVPAASLLADRLTGGSACLSVCLSVCVCLCGCLSVVVGVFVCLCLCVCWCRYWLWF